MLPALVTALDTCMEALGEVVKPWSCRLRRERGVWCVVRERFSVGYKRARVVKVSSTGDHFIK